MVPGAPVVPVVPVVPVPVVPAVLVCCVVADEEAVVVGAPEVPAAHGSERYKYSLVAIIDDPVVPAGS